MLKYSHFLILIVVIITIASAPLTHAFEVNFDIQTDTGNAVEDKQQQEEEKKTICGNVWCINDAHYLFGLSSRNSAVDPCVNDTLEDLDDADEGRHFYSIVEEIYSERLRKVLAARYDEDEDEDSRVVRVMKNTFRQCFNSLHQKKHLQAQNDVKQHLRGLGGAPVLSEWSEESFNSSLYFDIEPHHALNVFLDLAVGRCGDEVCLQRPKERFINFDVDFELAMFNELFESMEEAGDVRSAVEKKRFYLTYREFIKSEMVRDENERIKVKDLKEKFPPHFEVDWLSVINSELFEESRLSEEDEILIAGGVEAMQNLVYFILSERR
jgi:hypothetical protein